MDGHNPLEVGQRKIHASIAAVGGTQEREQRLVLIDRQKLSVAKRPPLRRETETHDLDLRQKRLRHQNSSLRVAGRRSGSSWQRRTCPTATADCAPIQIAALDETSVLWLGSTSCVL